MKRKLVLCVLLMSGCSLVSERVYLNPTVIAEEKNVGNGSHVLLIVDDKRNEKIVGYRNSMLGTGVITLAEDPVVLFTRKMKEILSAHGYVVDSQENGRNAQCHLTIMDFYYGMNPTLIDIQITTRVLVGIDIKGKDVKESYYNNYQSENHNSVFITPPADQNENFINQTLSKVLNNISQDDKIFETLNH